MAVAATVFIAPLCAGPAVAANAQFEQLLPDLYPLRDTCNVYLLRDGDRAVATGFGGSDVDARAGRSGPASQWRTRTCFSLRFRE